jgi:hypothetical protein
MMNLAKLAICISLLSTGLTAQTIAPPVAEYRGDKVNGMFEVRNNTDDSMAVVLATQSFTVDEHGTVQYRPLDKGIQVKVGASSFVLRPRDNRLIFYKASFPTSPTSFSVIATMTKAKQTEGLRVNYILPHMIYVYQKEKLGRSDIKLDVVDNVLRIHNLSQKLGRVSSVQLGREESGSFPLYPGQVREVPVAGNKVSVKFEDGFTAETK